MAKGLGFRESGGYMAQHLREACALPDDALPDILHLRDTDDVPVTPAARALHLQRASS